MNCFEQPVLETADLKPRQQCENEEDAGIIYFQKLLN